MSIQNRHYEDSFSLGEEEEEKYMFPWRDYALKLCLFYTKHFLDM